MAIKSIEVYGDTLIINQNGTRITAYRTPGGLYMPLTGGSGPPPDPDPDPDPPDPDGWMHPLGKQTPYSQREDGGQSHSGGAVDFGLGYGTEAPLYAAVSGPVLFAGFEAGGGGNVIVIGAPDGCGITYAHLNRVDVAVGSNVKVGDVIGLSGWTGNVIPEGPGGSHLHFEIRVNGIIWGVWHRAPEYMLSKGVTL